MTTPSLLSLPIQVSEPLVKVEGPVCGDAPVQPAILPRENSSVFSFLPGLRNLDSSDALSGLLRRASWFGAKQLDETAQPEAEPAQDCGNVTLLIGSVPPFGDVKIGTTASSYFTFSNPSGCSVRYTVSGGGYGFNVYPLGSGTLPPQVSVTIHVDFSPTSQQYYSGTASVNPNGGSTSFSGHGVP